MSGAQLSWRREKKIFLVLAVLSAVVFGIAASQYRSALQQQADFQKVRKMGPEDEPTQRAVIKRVDKMERLRNLALGAALFFVAIAVVPSAVAGALERLQMGGVGLVLALWILLLILLPMVAKYLRWF